MTQPDSELPPKLPVPIEDFDGDPQPFLRRNRRKIPIALGVLVALIVAIPTILSTSWVNGQIRDWLGENVTSPVDFESLEVSWTDGITLTGLEVHDRRDSGKPLVTAPRVELDVRLWSLLSQQLDVKHFVVIDPVIRIEQHDEGVNAEGVVRTRKAKRRRRKDDAPPAEDEEPTDIEDEILPDIRVPVEIRNATLIFVDREGREARRDGVGLTGNISTRSGTSTFALEAPGPDGSGLSITGSATLFEESGLPLPSEDRAFVADIALRRLEAAGHREILGLFLDRTPDSGVLDGTIHARRVKGVTEATVDLTVRGLAFPGATAADLERENLRVTGTVEAGNAEFAARGLRIVGEGIDVSADLGGSHAAMEGTASITADVTRAASALRSLGVNVPAGVGGRIVGRIDCSREPSEGRAHLEISALTIPAPTGSGSAVRLGDATLDALVRPGPESLRIEQLELAVAGASSHLKGAIGSDGTYDVIGWARADLAPLTQFLRTLELVPSGVAVDGQLDGRFHVARAADASAATIDVPELTISQDGTTISASGGLDAAGAVTFRAEGRGDLARVLASYEGPDGPLPSVPGNFQFVVTAAGDRAEPVVTIEELSLSGPLSLRAGGTFQPGGDLDLSVQATGPVERAVALCRRLGVLSSDVPLDGELKIDASVTGTTRNPVVPGFAVLIRDGSVRLDVNGSVDGEGRIAATADADAALDDLLALARAAGAVEHTARPGGRITLRAVVAGTRDKPVVPSARIALTGPANASADIAFDAAQRLSASGEIRGALQPLADLATALSGRERITITGDATGAFAVEGPIDGLTVSLPRLVVTTGGFRAEARVSRGPDGSGSADVTLGGPLEGLVSALHDAGYASDLGAAGDVDATVSVRLPAADSGKPATAALQGLVRRLSLLRATDAGSVFEEDEVRISLEEVRYDQEAGEVQSANGTLQLSRGLKADVSVRGASAQSGITTMFDISGALQPLLDAAAFQSGGVPGRVDGTVALAGSWTSAPAGDAFEITRGDITAGQLVAKMTGHRLADGAGRAEVSLTGEVESLVAVSKALDVFRDVDATGAVEGRLTLDLAGDDVRGSLDVTALDLHVLSPPVGEGTFREPRLRAVVRELRGNLSHRTFEPFDITLELEGGKLSGRTSLAGGTPPEGSQDAVQQLSVQGTLQLDEAFSRNHPELLSGVSLTQVAGPFRFAGDIGAGRERAAGWSGGFELTAANVVAPYVTLETLSANGVIADGGLTISPLDARVNGGTVTGTLELGLVGKQPAHRVSLRADNVGIDADLAPLVARAVPLLAGSEDGTATGRIGLDLDLSASGSKTKRVKRTADGTGVVRLRNVEVASTGLVGQILGLAGGGSGLSIPSSDVPFVVREGQVITEDLPIDAGGIALRLGGQVGLDGALDYALKLKPSSGGGTFEQYTRLFDDDGFLPLRLGGTLSDPDLKLPDVKEAVGNRLGDLWDKLRGKETKDEDEEAKKRRQRRNKRRREKNGDPEEDDVAPPPPPPPRRD